MAERAEWVRIASGSFGSRNGQPWSRELSTANARTAPSDTSAGIHGSVVAPSKEALRAAIESQTCPWCGRGPFKVLALHTNREHGVGRMDLCDMAGLPRSSSICDPASSEASRAALLGREDRNEMTMKGVAAGQVRGVEVSRELNASRYSDSNRDRDNEIIAAVQSGRLRRDVAQDFNVTYKTVLAIMKRHGVMDDGRKDRGLERKGVMPASARAGANRRQAERLAERARRWAELGGDHAALLALASELGTSHKTIRSYFKEAGLDVPDGRIPRG